MKVIVPMAGKGSRFKSLASCNLEYALPKPLIPVRGQAMITWAMRSLPFFSGSDNSKKVKLTAKDLIFIVLGVHQSNFQIADKLRSIFSSEITVLFLPKVSRGALETVLAAKDYFNDEEIIISDSDHFFRGGNYYEMITAKEKDVMGVIPVFRPPDDEVKWSYSLFDENFVVKAVGEKDAELAARGAYANIGAYYFTHGSLFLGVAEDMVRQGEMSGPMGRQEFYIAPVYQRLIEKGMKIKASVIPEVWGLGTPKDLEYFLKTYK